MERYKLPVLPYDYKDLEPYMSEEVLRLHHDKHHAGYVNAANSLLDKIDEVRKNGSDLDFKSVFKSLSFNAGGHILHDIFWRAMCPSKNSGKPEEELSKAIDRDFGSFERFRKEFSEIAKSVEGSGWAALVYDVERDNLAIAQIEKHNVNFFPEQKILLCLDVWEHAYYLDYKNDRVKFVEDWWNIVNWEEVNRRFK